MPEEVVYYITRYGYFAIFVLIFLQEIGMPNPFPNELLIMFSGYLSYKGLLFLPLVIITVFSADLLGTCLLYFIFYSTGNYIFNKKPKWLPLSDRIINKLTTKISDGSKHRIFLFRLTPFTRGYTSVITGLLRISPKVFLPIAFLTALTWAAFYAVLGNLTGPSWNILAQYFGNSKYIMLSVLTLAIFIMSVIYIKRKRKKLIEETAGNKP